MTVIEIFLLILITVAIILGIYLIVTLKKINVSLDLFQKDISSLNSKIDPIIENLTVISDKALRISGETEKHIFNISDSIQNVRDKFSKLSIKNISLPSKNSASDFANNLGAALKGVSAFWRKFNN
ncbi:MAG: DUF948 domain-containing protein [Ignavibacteriae bacterium]|nr:DUF948 domain-containing protein [Ignavibacteriota bacterium]